MNVLSPLSTPLHSTPFLKNIFFHIWEMWKFDIKKGCCFLHRIKFPIFGINLSGHLSAPATASEQANMAPQVLTCKLPAC